MCLRSGNGARRAVMTAVVSICAVPRKPGCGTGTVRSHIERQPHARDRGFNLPERKNCIAIQCGNPISRYWQTTCAVSIFAVP